MCGIAGFHVKKGMQIKSRDGVESLVDNLLLGIEKRGKHATGFVAVTKNGKTIQDKNDVTATEFIKDRTRIPADARTVLLHTRHWTKGDPVDHRNNHPVLSGSCFAVHNGQISNDDELFEERKLARGADVDSIIIPAMVTESGFDNIKTIAEQWEGSFATAIIDPVKNPGELLLVRGNHTSPLVMVNHDNYVIWASTQDAIKDAWVKVFGTPPDAKRFEHVPAGTILRWANDGTQTTEKFEVKVKKTFTNGANTNHGAIGTGTGVRRIGSLNGTPMTGPGFKPKFGFQAPTVHASLKAARPEIREYLDTGEGEVRRKSTRKADAKSGRLAGTVVWVYCEGCEENVARDDKRTSVWGEICNDCYSVMRAGVDRKYEGQIPDAELDALTAEGATGTLLFDSKFGGDLCAGTSVPRIAATHRDSLETWANAEQDIHEAALAEVYNRVGSYYSIQLITFLIFLAGDLYREQAPDHVGILIDQLKDEYEDSVLALMENGVIDNPSPPNLRPNLPPVPNVVPDVYCEKHKIQYRMDAGFCYKCNDEDLEALKLRLIEEGDSCGVQIVEGDTEIENVVDRLLDLPACPECNTHVMTKGGECAVCKHNKKREAEIAAAVAYTPPGPTNFTIINECHRDGCTAQRRANSFYCSADCRTHVQKDWGVAGEVREDEPLGTSLASVHPIDQGVRCNTCQSKRAAKFILVVPDNTNTKLGFCGRHYEKCHHAGCKSDAIFLKGIHVRLCHQHARSQSGLLSDKELAKRKYQLIEVVR